MNDLSDLVAYNMQYTYSCEPFVYNVSDKFDQGGIVMTIKSKMLALQCIKDVQSISNQTCRHATIVIKPVAAAARQIQTLLVVLWENEWKDGILHEIIERASGESVQVHQIVKVGHSANQPQVLHRL